MSTPHALPRHAATRSLSLSERDAYYKGLKAGRAEAEAAYRKLPAETWCFPVGPHTDATIHFYGRVPTKEDVRVLLEYLAIVQRTLAVDHAPAAADVSPEAER